MDLRRFRKANNLSQGTIAAYLGVGQSFISQVERGVSPLPENLQEKILSNPEWAIPSGLFDKSIEEIESKEAEEKDNRLPLIPFDAIAGPGTFNYSELPVEDYYEIRELQNNDFLIRVKGDSMVPKYAGGDLVACRIVNDRLFFQWGRVYIINTKSQGVMIKRLQPSEKEGCVKCVSDNTKYAPFDIPQEDIAALALVNGSISLE